MVDFAFPDINDFALMEGSWELFSQDPLFNGRFT